MSSIHSFSMEGRHATVTYCRPHFTRYHLFHYSCVCFIWKNVMKFFFPSQKYIFPYLIKSLSHTAPIPRCHQSSCSLPRVSQMSLLFKKYKRNAGSSFSHSQSIIQFKVSGNVDEILRMKWTCVWLTVSGEIRHFFPKCYDLQFLLYVECNICFESL